MPRSGTAWFLLAMLVGCTGMTVTAVVMEMRSNAMLWAFMAVALGVMLLIEQHDERPQ